MTRGGRVELRAPPPLVVVLVVIPVVTVAVIVLLSRIIRFVGNGSGGGVIVPEGVAIAGVAAGRSMGAVITVVTVDPSVQRGRGDGAAPGGRRHQGTIAPTAAATSHPPPWLRPRNMGRPP